MCQLVADADLVALLGQLDELERMHACVTDDLPHRVASTADDQAHRVERHLHTAKQAIHPLAGSATGEVIRGSGTCTRSP